MDPIDTSTEEVIYAKPQAGDNVIPAMDGYHFMCCDCRLVHVLYFEVGRFGEDGVFYPIPDAQVSFRCFRHNAETQKARARRTVERNTLKATKASKSD